MFLDQKNQCQNDYTIQSNLQIQCNLYQTVVAQMVKHLPTMWETQVQSLGWENPLEEGMATHSSSIPAWRIPWSV